MERSKPDAAVSRSLFPVSQPRLWAKTRPTGESHHFRPASGTIDTDRAHPRPVQCQLRNPLLLKRQLDGDDDMYGPQLLRLRLAQGRGPRT